MVQGTLSQNLLGNAYSHPLTGFNGAVKKGSWWKKMKGVRQFKTNWIERDKCPARLCSNDGRY